MNKKTNINFRIVPIEIEAGEQIKIQCEFSGSLHFGFFDLALLIDKEKFTLWMPDENTWNVYRDTGILRGTGPFSTEWNPFIPDWVPHGEYEVLVLVYDDKVGKNLARTPIAKRKHKITIKDSSHPEAVFVRKMYQLLLERIPEVTGYRTWFENLQIRNVDRRQVLEIGFLRSIEFKARFIHKLITNEKIDDKELESSIQILRRYSISKLFSEKYSSKISSRKELQNLVIKYLKLDEKGIEELARIEKTSGNVAEILVSILGNFLLEKYILVRYLFPDLSREESQKKLNMYLTNPEGIINEI